MKDDMNRLRVIDQPEVRRPLQLSYARLPVCLDKHPSLQVYSYLRLPGIHARGFWPGFHSHYPAIEPRGRSARLLSRCTLAWRISALPSSMLFFRALILLLPTTCPSPDVALGSEAREERGGPCTGMIAHLTVLRVPVRTSVL